jgi:uncharacterized protein YggU (UPF0235/DUF167 family)
MPRRSMARPKADLPLAEAILALADDRRRLALRVTPGAREESISLLSGVVCMKVRARPEGGAANEAVLALLAKALGLPRSSVTLLRGATSREKLVQLPD